MVASPAPVPAIACSLAGYSDELSVISTRKKFREKVQ
jgi:hypothetical protein